MRSAKKRIVVPALLCFFAALIFMLSGCGGEPLEKAFNDIDKNEDIEAKTVVKYHMQSDTLEVGIYQDADIDALASEISKFRKWYVHDLNAFNKLTGEESSVRDARYDIAAAKLLGEDSDYDFRLALDYDLDGFDVRISDMIGASLGEAENIGSDKMGPDNMRSESGADE